MTECGFARIEPWGKTGVDEAEEYFREQVAGLLEGGVGHVGQEGAERLRGGRGAVRRAPVQCYVAGQEVLGVKGRPAAALGTRPDAKNWSATEVLCHLRDTEELFMMRFETIMAADEPKVAAIDPDRWAQDGCGAGHRWPGPGGQPGLAGRSRRPP